MLFTLIIQTNGQPAIDTDLVEMYALAESLKANARTQGFGFDLHPKGLKGVTRSEQIKEAGKAARKCTKLAAQVRAYDSGLGVRRCPRRVTVRHPSVLVAEYDALDATWQALASGGASHHEAQNAMINEPTFRNSAFRA